MTKMDITPSKDAPVANTPVDCVCATCGHEQETMDPCGKCRSVRVVLQSVIQDLVGDNWRDCFKDGAEKTP